MHPQKLEAFAARLDEFVSLMESSEHLELVSQSRTRRILHEGITLQLSAVTGPVFENMRQKMLSEPTWTAKYSERTLEAELSRAIIARQSGSSAREYITQMALRLDATQPRHRVWVPISGVSLAVDTNFSFGRVELVQMTDAIFETEVAARLPSTVTVQGAEDIFLYTVEIESDLDHAALYAVYTIDADALKATEVVDDFVGPVADYLQFCLADTADRYSSIVDYKGRYRRRNINTALVVDEQSGQAQLLALDERTLVRMTINQARLAILSQQGITALAPVFGRNNVEAETEYTQLIFRAVRVFAEGERSTSLRQRILSYVTACEVFFAEKGDVTRTVTEGVAYIIGTDYEGRKAVLKAMRDMYDVRSSATHTGLEPSNVALYRRQVLYVLRHMIAVRKNDPERFQTKADIMAWIDRQRFSGETVP